jgi:predicted ferric reductase
MQIVFETPRADEVKRVGLWLLLAVNAVVIGIIWFTRSSYYIQSPGGGNILVAFGRLTGLISQYALLIQLVLIGRIRPIEQLFGFDKLNRFHRFIGYCVALPLLVHPAFLVYGYAMMNGVSVVSQLGDFLANWEHVFLAFVSFALIVFVVFASIAIVRKKVRYETWYGTHLLAYVAIVLAFLHQIESGDVHTAWPLTYWLALNFTGVGLVLLYRFLRPLYLFARHQFTVESVEQETEGVYSLTLSGRRLDAFHFEAGQYANILILRRGMLQFHPFSFSAAQDGKRVRFTIKALGDYTKKIGAIPPGTKVIVDGPLGRFVKSTALREKYLFIAGGIGITPIRAMLEELGQEKKDVVVLYANRTERDIALRAELDAIATTVPSVRVVHVVSEPTPGLETGRIDRDKIVRLVPDFFDREVYVCGPPPMMNALISGFKTIGFTERHLHYEKFAF